MNSLQHTLRLAIVAAVSTTLIPGCGEKKPTEEIITLEGKIEKIDARADGSGRITVVYRDKKDVEMAGIGEVTSETEIMINGAVAKLSDLKVGERVRGQVKVTKQNNQRKQVVLKITAERTELSQPAEPPAGGG
jgi:hypothetical protein